MEEYKSWDVSYFNKVTGETVTAAVYARSEQEAYVKARQEIKGRLDKSWKVKSVSETPADKFREEGEEV